MKRLPPRSDNELPLTDRPYRNVNRRPFLTPRIRGKLVQLPADLLQRMDSEGELDPDDVKYLVDRKKDHGLGETVIVLGIVHCLNSYFPIPSKFVTKLKSLQEEGALRVRDSIEASFLPQESGASELILYIDFGQRALYEPVPLHGFEELFQKQLPHGGDLPCGTKFTFGFDPDSEAFPRLLIQPKQFPERRLTKGILLGYENGEVTMSDHEDYLYYEADEEVVWLHRNYFLHRDAVWKQAQEAGAYRDVLITTLVDELKAIGEENKTHWKKIHDHVYERRICPRGTVAYLLYNNRYLVTEYKDSDWQVKGRNGWFWVEEIQPPVESPPPIRPVDVAPVPQLVVEENPPEDSQPPEVTPPPPTPSAESAQSGGGDSTSPAVAVAARPKDIFVVAAALLRRICHGFRNTLRRLFHKRKSI